jgi:hypothetical protein
MDEYVYIEILQVNVHPGKLISRGNIGRSGISGSFIFLHCSEVIARTFQALYLAPRKWGSTFPIQHMMIELEGLRLLAALKHLIAASFLPDLNSTVPNPYLDSVSASRIVRVLTRHDTIVCLLVARS